MTASEPKPDPCPLSEAHKPHDWLPFPGSGLIHKGIVRCPGMPAATTEQ